MTHNGFLELTPHKATSREYNPTALRFQVLARRGFIARNDLGGTGRLPPWVPNPWNATAFVSDFEAGSPANAWASVRGWYANFPKPNTSSFVAGLNWLKGRSLRWVMWRNPECLCVIKPS
jgi:hypothetical protein